MQCADASLEDALTREHWAGINGDMVRMVIKQLCDIVEHIHAAGILHADLKPRNLVRERDTYRAIDFDAATEVGGTLGLKIVPGCCPANAAPELAKSLFRLKYNARQVAEILQVSMLSSLRIHLCYSCSHNHAGTSMLHPVVHPCCFHSASIVCICVPCCVDAALMLHLCCIHDASMLKSCCRTTR